MLNLRFIGKVFGESAKFTKNRNPSIQVIERSLEVSGNCIAILIGLLGIYNGIANFKKNSINK